MGARIIEGWMGDHLYRKLGTEPDIEVTWRLIRELVGEQLLSSEYVTVPYFESAVYYNQMFVFKKKRNMFSCLGVECPTYKIVGNLDYLVDRDVSTWTPQCDFSTWDVADTLTNYREYRLSISSNTPNEAKSLEFVVMGAHIRRAQPPEPGSLKIHMNLLQDLDGVKALYVITDVVFASYMRLTVRIGTNQRRYVYDMDTPIAFNYRKYRVKPDGRFIGELRTSLKLYSKSANWLCPSPQPVPWWDSRRRFSSPGGTRKTKSNLTIRSPEDTHGRNGRRTWAQEAGALREVRVAADVDNLQDDQDNEEEELPRNIRLRNYRRRRAMSLANIQTDRQF